MKIEEAEYCLGLLVGGTGGWNSATDETLAIYLTAIQQLEDPVICQSSVEEIVMTWSEQRRPPIAKVIELYRNESRRQLMDRPQLTGPQGATIDAKEGRKIAAAAYAKQCKIDGREPNWIRFDRLLGSAGAQ